MSTKPEQPEPQKRNLVEEYLKAANFGAPPEVCRQLEKPLSENERNIVDELIKTADFGLAKRS